jgi:hypothetical protein
MPPEIRVVFWTPVGRAYPQDTGAGLTSVLDPFRSTYDRCDIAEAELVRDDTKMR